MEPKKNSKKNYKMIVIMVIVLALFGVMIYLIKTRVGNNTGENNTNAASSTKNIDFNIVDTEEKLVQTRFLNKAEEEIRQFGAENRQTVADVKRLSEKVERLNQMLKDQKAAVLKAQTPEQLPTPPDKDFSDIFTNFPNGLPQQNKTPKIKNPFKEKEEIYYEYEKIDGSMELASVEQGTGTQEGSVTSNGKQQQLGTGKSGIPDDAVFIPAGSVTVAYLEQGYDAPTLKNGKGDLVPSTYTIVGYTLMPNNKMFDLRGCKVLAEAEGKRSNERAYSRTRRMSCIDSENRPMDIPLMGYISDEGGDGKLGLKGNIVTMQNKFLQNAIWISVVEGVASIGKATSTLQTVTPQGGVISTIDQGREFQAGAAEGLVSATSSIKDFLLDNVKSIEPVVEIKGGRLVAITLTEGFYVYPRIEYAGKDKR